MILMDLNKKYFHPMQIRNMTVAAKNTYLVCSRRWGKSEGADAPALIRSIQSMPGCLLALLSPTYGKLLKNTLPAVARSLARWGYYRDIHYVIGRKPDKRMGFKSPIIEPFSYENAMTWYNGSIATLVSFDRSMSVNSMTLDGLFGFEAKFLDYTQCVEEVFPANSPDDEKRKLFKNVPWYNGMFFSTDMPTTSRGKWILEKEHEMNPRLIQHILDTYDLYKYYDVRPDANSRQKARMLMHQINAMRRKATYYYEGNIYDNIDIVGHEYVANMKRDLPDLLFKTSILNKRVHKVPNGFYAALDDSLHMYDATYDNAKLDALCYDLSKSAINNCFADGDLLPDQPLEISADYNAAINNIVVAQKAGTEMRNENRFFVKTPKKLRDVAQAFCDYYLPRSNRDVIYYYDSTAVASSALSDTTFAEEIISVLSDRGFNVTPVYLGQPEKHDVKHIQIDNALKGDPRFLFPVFNSDRCADLVLSMQLTGVSIGRNGFEKNKASEKRPDSPEEPDELKPHGTDAWDTLFIGMNFHRPIISHQSYASRLPS
jgi:hypothetical protein